MRTLAVMLVWGRRRGVSFQMQWVGRRGPFQRKATTKEWSPDLVRETAKKAREMGLTMPQRLSPSAITAYLDCEQLFLFRYIWKLPEKPSPAMERGILVHKVLEEAYATKTFDAGDAHQKFRDLWLRERDKKWASFFESLDAEKTWGLEALEMISKYFRIEDPQNVTVRDIERWVDVKIDTPPELPPLTVVGKLDRLDDVDGELRIVDYKTSSPPSQKPYSPSFIRSLQDKAFFQLKLYAFLLAQEQRKGRPSSDVVKHLRLIYLGGGDTGAIEDLMVDPTSFDGIKSQLTDIWASIYAKVQSQDPTAFNTCGDRSFCFCRDIQPLVFPPEEEEDLEVLLAAAEQQQDSPPDQPSISMSTEEERGTTEEYPPLPDDLEDLYVAQLRALCRERKIDSVVKRGTPTKATLIHRLRTAVPQ